MPIGKIQGKHLVDGAVTTSKIAPNSVTPAKLVVSTSPKVTNVIVIDEFNIPTGVPYGSINNTKVRITGNNFVNGAQVFVEIVSANGYQQRGYLANTIVYNNSTNLFANFSGLPVGEYNMYVINPDSSVAFVLSTFGALPI
ncbi:MAG: hypothetical protein EBU90_11045 [Proteobacteria bacterium]|nr:hypothetical protein [Pseudomonadota bacterium]NBP14443.1 hypothetical protein [bacterium]